MVILEQDASQVDNKYIVVGARIDSTVKDKIAKGEYVNFVKLLPRDRAYDDNRLELINKGRQTYFVPVSQRDPNYNTISSFHKWEQAFRVYSNIYLKHHPEQATQLIEYNHIICTASATFLWENMYAYDKEFRAHMGNFPG